MLIKQASLVTGLILLLLAPQSGLGFAAEAAIAEAAEIIGIVRLGVSLVEYTYKGKI